VVLHVGFTIAKTWRPEKCLHLLLLVPVDTADLIWWRLRPDFQKVFQVDLR
jgi:hypothetical protein